MGQNSLKGVEEHHISVLGIVVSCDTCCVGCCSGVYLGYGSGHQDFDPVHLCQDRRIVIRNDVMKMVLLHSEANFRVHGTTT